MTSRENYYILGYRGPNGNPEVVPKRAQNLHSVVRILDLEDETVTCGSPYNFAILNSPEIGHLWKLLISPNW